MDRIDENFLFVNWIDGMKINKSHFLSSDNANIQYATNAVKGLVKPNSYGLLPILSELDNPVDIQLSLDGQNTLVAQLNNCIALTSNGIYIEVSDQIKKFLKTHGDFDVIQTSLNFQDNSDDHYYIVLSVDLYDRVGVGETNSKENPPRHPYTLPKYTIAIVQEQELANNSLGGNYLTIGKIQINGGTPALMPDYIPPCISVKSHPDLIYIYTELGVFLSSVEKYSLQIIQKILQKKQTNELANMVQHVCQQTLNFISTILPKYILDGTNQPPLDVILTLMSMARVIKNNIDIYKGTGKEELINYLTSWTESTQGDFEKTLEDIIHLKYKHYDLNLSLHTISKFSKIILTLFKKLDDLDYIGQKSDSNIFVKEEVVAKQDVKQRRSFLLD